MDGAYVALTATLAQTGRSLVVVCTDGYDTVELAAAGGSAREREAIERRDLRGHGRARRGAARR